MASDPKILRKIIEDGELEQCAAFLIGCSFQELKAAGMVVKEILPWVLKEDEASPWPGKTEEEMARRRQVDKRRSVLGLAVLATGSLADMKALPSQNFPYRHPDILRRVLLTINVPWLSSWINSLNKGPYGYHYQCLIEAGFGPDPQNDDDVLGYISARWSRPLTSECITQNVTEAIWKFFEVEGHGEQSLAAVDKYRSEKLTWAYNIKRFMEEGKLERDRLLDASLDALARDFAQFRAGWFSRFHESLEPTIEERIQRTNRYLKLLASMNPPTVSFAINALGIINKAKALSSEDIINHIRPALLSKHKSTALKALGLLENMTKQEKNFRSQVLRLVAESLITDSTEVQERLFKILKKYSGQMDETVKNGIRNIVENLSASVQMKIINLLPEMKRRSIPSASFHGSANELPVSPLDLGRAITPIENLEELMEKSAYILENPNDIAETERVLDGLVRFSNMDKTHMERAIKPLLKRAVKIQEKAGKTFDEQAQALIAQSIRACFDPALVEAKEYVGEQHYPLLRLHQILQLIQKRQGLPLLSTPTHQGFWIDPRVLVKRYKEWNTQNKVCDIYDSVIAFLRMGFEHRNAALHDTKELSSPYPALRYALGADEPIGGNKSLWTAASRARYCDRNDEALAQKYPDLGPGGAILPTVEWKIGTNIAQWKDDYGKEMKRTHYYLEYVLEPPIPDKLVMPVIMYHFKYFYHGNLLGGYCASRRAFAVYASYWPAFREPLYLHGAAILGSHSYSMEVDTHKVFVLLEMLSDPFEKFGPFACLFLNFGLSCPHTDGRAAAINAFITGVQSGNLSGQELGQSLMTFFTSGMIYPTRIRKSLDEIIRVSSKHRRAVLMYLGQLMRGDPTKTPDGMAGILELYYELMVEHDEYAKDKETITYLRAFPGGGRAAKLAKQIVEHKRQM